jgi:hypothetical protein
VDYVSQIAPGTADTGARAYIRRVAIADRMLESLVGTLFDDDDT